MKLAGRAGNRCASHRTHRDARHRPHKNRGARMAAQASEKAFAGRCEPRNRSGRTGRDGMHADCIRIKR
jgi:hypothetical protein